MKKPISVLLSLTLVGSLAAAPAAAVGLDEFKPTLTYPQGLFQDVGENDWFAPQVAHTYELDLLKGTGPDAFSPYGTVDLASAVTLAARLHAIYFEDKVVFDQSQGNAWYDTYVNYAVKQGFWTVDSRPDYAAPVSRAQLAALLFAALPKDAFAPVNDVADAAIPDVDEADDYADAIFALYRAGVLTGVDANGSFAPDRPLTRAELSVVTARTADPEQRKHTGPSEGEADGDSGSSGDADSGDADHSGGGGGNSGGGEPSAPPAVTPTPTLPETPAPSETPAPTQTPAPTPPAVSPSPAPTPSQAPSEAQAVLDLVNQARTENGLSPLTLDTSMTQAANTRAQETVQSFSHTRPDGSDFSTALTQAGVTFRAWGENIAYGQTTPESVMEAWMNSSGHRANILNPGYSRLGVGLAYNGSTPYWVQLFCD